MEGQYNYVLDPLVLPSPHLSKSNTFFSQHSFLSWATYGGRSYFFCNYLLTYSNTKPFPSNRT